MKFDFCIGNPPYQDESIGKNEAFAPPVYNSFLDAAFEIADKVEMIHPARFLFDAGSTPKQWNKKMLLDEHFKVMEYEEDCTKVFNNTDIKGGIAITYRDKTKSYGAIETFTPYEELQTIFKKVRGKKEKSITDIIFTQNKFDLDELYAINPAYKDKIGSNGKDKRFRNNIFNYVLEFKQNREFESDIAVRGVIKNKREWRYISRELVDMFHENIRQWKVILPRANGSGKLGDVFSPAEILKPFEGYTQTFIGIGRFEKSEVAENAFKYLKTKFLRVMLSLLKVTQDNDRNVWKYVPLQDFTEQSDINWNTSIPEIDQQLYKKYGLSEDEINFIETHVKEMK